MKRMAAVLMTLLLCVILCPSIAKAGDDGEINEKCIVSVAIDVSGSMRRTDASRDVPETVKMLIDVCDENDYFSVVAYNDKIAYASGLISTGDAAATQALKNDLDGLVYEGNTDNGLGLMHAVKEVTDFAGERDRALVILISDGNTDLVGSTTGRGAEDSRKDIEKSAELAKAQNVPIYVIEYTNDFTTDTSLMSIATSATGGAVTMVDEKQKFVQVMLNSFFTGYGNGKTFYQTAEADEKLNRTKFDSVASESEHELFFLYSWEIVADVEVLDKDFAMEPETAGRYLILEAKEQGPKSVEVLYGLVKKGKVLLGTVKIPKVMKPAEQEVIIKEIEVVTTPESAIPEGHDEVKEVYSSKEKLRVGVSTLFVDDDIVSYELKNADEVFALEEGMLTADVSKEGEYAASIVAKDAAGNAAEAVMIIRVTASWKRYQKQIIIGIILAIVLVTVIICVVIVRRLLFHREEKKKAFCGELRARFIDIKSKNDFDEVRWRLKDYSPDGVTLEELFRSKGIREELKDIDKVCFYPGEEDHVIYLVHCIEGGVFVGDHHVTANVPTIVRPGDKVYVSIAENASEIELTYLGS